MFNIGPAELIVIFLVALLVVGPKRLPEVGRSIGKALREFRRTTEEVRSTFEASLDDDEEASANGQGTIRRLAEPDDPDEMPVHDITRQEPTHPEDPGTAPPADRG
jgi:sec-independent protein translocase protein TatA